MHVNRHFDAQSILLSRKGHFATQYINVPNINSETDFFTCFLCKMYRVADVFALQRTNSNQSASMLYSICKSLEIT